MKRYVLVTDYESAKILQAKLQDMGVKEEDVSIIIQSASNCEDIDTSQSTLLKQETATKEDAPTGTVSAFGATFTVLSGVAGGALLAGIGPIAAIAGAAAVAAGGVSMLLSGLGVPEKDHDYFSAALEQGDVLVALDTDAYPQARPLMEQHAEYNVA